MDKSDVAKGKRPNAREKLAKLGPAALRDSELLMVMLGSGSRQYPIRVVAQKLTGVLRSKRGGLSLNDVSEVPGVGLAKGAALLASFELARRRIDNATLKVRKPRDLLPLLHDLKGKKQEHFVVVTLNGNHEVLHSRTITVGLANYCQVHPREVFADALQDRATSVILAHNHPSGNLEPSREDLDVTSRLINAGKILGITVIDHVIISKRGMRSLRETEPHLF